MKVCLFHYSHHKVLIHTLYSYCLNKNHYSEYIHNNGIKIKDTNKIKGLQNCMNDLFLIPLLLSVSANNRRCTHSTNGEIR